MKKVSVIVPAYNVERYIDKCIQSILNQTYKNYELIVIDDGSKDKTGNMCDRYAELPNVIIIHQKNGGLSAARNTGIHIATGDFLYFVDSDDYIEQNTLQRHMEMIEEDDLDISLADVFIVDEDGRKSSCSNISFDSNILTGEEYLAERIKKQSYFTMVYMGMYRASLIKENNLLFHEGIVHEDEDWSPRVLLAAERVRYTPECFYDYVQHHESITKSTNKLKNLESTFIVCSELEEFFTNVSLRNEDNRQYYFDVLARLYMSMSCCGNFPKSYYRRFDKSFPQKYAYLSRTKKQVLLYTFSIRLYRYIRKFIDRVNHIR